MKRLGLLPPPSGRHWLGVLLVCAGGLLTGCSVLDSQSGWSWSEPSPDLPLLEREFVQKAWRPQADWNPLVELAEYPRCPSDPISRWMHPIAPAAIIAVNSEGSDPEEAVVNQSLERFAKPLGKSFVEWNATVVYAQQSNAIPAGMVQTLQRLVTKPPTYQMENKPKSTIAMSMRLSAAEAWCRALAMLPGESESDMAPAGWAVQRKDLPAPVRDELLRGLGRRVAPQRIPGLAEALRTSDGGEAIRGTRRAAIDACVLYAIHNPLTAQVGLPAAPQTDESDSGWDEAPIEDASVWPAEVWSLRFDNDSYVRSRYATLLTVLNHPLAVEVLEDQLRDTEFPVVRSACLCLGLLRTPETRKTLEEFANRTEERSGACAAYGLACFGAEALVPLTKHKSTAARAEAVRRLAIWPGAIAIPIVATAFNDNQPLVQKAAMDSARAWPDPDASIVFLQVAVESPSLPTRRNALRELEKRHGAVSFPIDAEPQLRTSAADHLTRTWNLIKPVSPTALPNAEEAVRLAGLRRAEVRERLDLWRTARQTDREREAAEWFLQLKADDLGHLEALLNEVDLHQEAFLIASVLPRLQPAWGALSKMDVNQPLPIRQQATRDLRLAARDRPLSLELLRRLHGKLVREPDAQVWREVMLTVRDDRRTETANIVHLALHSTWADVRQLGCEHLQRLAQPDFAVWVMPLFVDDNPSVKLAAIRAAAACQNPIVLDSWTPPGTTDVVVGLRSLLATSQGEQQLGVIAGLSRLGDETGHRELTRLIHSDSPATRTSAAKIMGETSQTQFVEPLIHLIWTESAPEVRAAALASLTQLVPPEQRPPGLAEARAPAKSAELWNLWLENRKAGVRG